MKSANHTPHIDTPSNHTSTSIPWTPTSLATIRTTARDYANPVDYQHPYPSMARFADHLALAYDANRTRHAYYRQLRLVHQHFGCDPVHIQEAQLRDYFLFVKLKKRWKPKSIRQALAAASMFFVSLLGHRDWTVFSQIRTKDHDSLPEVLTRKQVHDLLTHIRLRRYRTPLKLIYCCGLRLPPRSTTRTGRDAFCDLSSARTASRARATVANGPSLTSGSAKRPDHVSLPCGETKKSAVDAVVSEV